MRHVVAVFVLLGLTAGQAYAIAPCGQVCRGRDEPCSLRCYLPGPFVTTCDQVYGGHCVPFAAPEDEEELVEAGVCEAEPELSQLVTAALDASVPVAASVASMFGAVLG
jgi:hypothetical protein